MLHKWENFHAPYKIPVMGCAALHPSYACPNPCVRFVLQVMLPVYTLFQGEGTRVIN